MLSFYLYWSKKGPISGRRPFPEADFECISGERFTFRYNDSRSIKKVLQVDSENSICICVPKHYLDPNEATKGLPAALNGDGDLFHARSKYYLALRINDRDGKLKLLNDPFGSLTVFYYDDNEKTIFATDPAFITQHLDTIEFNDEGLCDFVNFGCTVLNKTLFKSIRQLANAAEITIGNGGLRHSTYWKSRVRDDDSKTPVPDLEESIQVITAAIRKSAAGLANPAVALSAGLDSRLITAALADCTPMLKTFHACGYRETKLSERIASIAGLPYKTFDMGGQDWSLYIRDYSTTSFGHLHWNQFWGMRLADCIAAESDPPQALFNGYMFDGLFNCWYTPLSSNNRRLNRGKVLSAMRRFFPIPSDRILRSIYNRELVRRIKQSFESNIIQFFEANSSLGLFELQENFYLENRGKNYTSAMFKYADRFVETVFPGLEPEVFSLAMRVPLGSRWSGELYRNIFIEAFPEYARIPYPKLGGDLVRGTVMSARLKKRLVAELKYYSARLSKGKLQLHASTANNYYRFMKDRDYRSIYLILLADSELHRRGYLAPNAPANIVRLLEGGNKNMMWHLQTLLTVDLFLKHNFGRPEP